MFWKWGKALNACPGRRGGHPSRSDAEGSGDALWKHQAFGILGLLFLLQEMFLTLGESWVHVPWSVSRWSLSLEIYKDWTLSSSEKPSPNKGMSMRKAELGSCIFLLLIQCYWGHLKSAAARDIVCGFCCWLTCGSVKESVQYLGLDPELWGNNLIKSVFSLLLIDPYIVEYEREVSSY